MLAQAVGKLKLDIEQALDMDINLLFLCLFYHEEDLLKMNGVWPEQKKPAPTMRQIRQALKG